MLDLQGSQSTVLVRMNVTAHRHSVSIQMSAIAFMDVPFKMQIDRLVAFIHSALFGLLHGCRYFCQFGMFIIAVPTCLFLICFYSTKWFLFPCQGLLKNIDSTYIGNYYFKNKIHKNKDKFDQLLVLGIGLDTKADVMEELEGKQVFGLDISADNISNIYEEADMTTKSIILNCDLTNLKKENVLKKLKDVGFSLEKKRI
ncbi:hypothetical protein P7H22_12010 [Paenibacillus larvae]|nr:hypothetical protein [Paenibacillus larvae]MDT2240938.1 hypothetical protein [Paenibacillus larvae]